MNPRSSMLEFCDRSRSGEVEGVEWVEATLDLNAPLGRLCRSADGQERFSFTLLADVLPEAMVGAVAEAQARGEPLVLDGVHYLFARLDRLLASRRFWWSPVGPEPGLLEFLAEAYAVPQELHLRDPERLSRLAAWLSHWQPGRGQVDRAALLYEAVTGEPLPEAWAHREQAGPAPDRPDLRREIFACHGEGWWEARGGDEFTPEYRIEDGMLCFQPRAAPLPLSAEDAAVELAPGAEPTAAMTRLIPAWMSLRPCLPG